MGAARPARRRRHGGGVLGRVLSRSTALRCQDPAGQARSRLQGPKETPTEEPTPPADVQMPEDNIEPVARDSAAASARPGRDPVRANRREDLSAVKGDLGRCLPSAEGEGAIGSRNRASAPRVAARAASRLRSADLSGMRREGASAQCVGAPFFVRVELSGIGGIRRRNSSAEFVAFRPALTSTRGHQMGDKSPKSKQRNNEQKTASKQASAAKAKSKRDDQTRTPPVIKKK